MLEQLLGRAQSLCVQNNPGSSILNALEFCYVGDKQPKGVSWSSQGGVEPLDAAMSSVRKKRGQPCNRSGLDPS